MLGGSAGGFASLFYAAQVAVPAIAVPLNPQTNISRYDAGHLKRFARVCFGWREGQDVEASYGRLIDFDLVDLYRVIARPPIVYIQNAADWHVEKHAIPFLRNYGLAWNGHDQLCGALYLHAGAWGDGHAPVPKDLVVRLLTFLCDWEGTWEEAVRSPLLPASLHAPASAEGAEPQSGSTAQDAGRAGSRSASA